MFAGAARVAGTIKDDFGWKVNGEYLRADDFRPDRASGTHDFGTDRVREATCVDNYDVRASQDRRDAVLPHGDWLATAGAGLSDATGFAITNAGRNHLAGWQVQYQTATVSSPHLYAPGHAHRDGRGQELPARSARPHGRRDGRRAREPARPRSRSAT